jgi:catechol 2,3-dioxygenase-like lactoylglutathione lyase family enzyme
MKLEQLKAAVEKATKSTALVHVPRHEAKADRVVYPSGGVGKFNGKHIVLIDNDEGFAEYAYMDDEGNFLGPVRD